MSTLNENNAEKYNSKPSTYFLFTNFDMTSPSITLSQGFKLKRNDFE